MIIFKVKMFPPGKGVMQKKQDGTGRKYLPIQKQVIWKNSQPIIKKGTGRTGEIISGKEYRWRKI